MSKRTNPPPPSWARRAVLGVITMPFLASAASPQLPYVPSQILMPSCVNATACHGIEAAYLFKQTDSGDVEFLSLNYSAKIEQNEGYTSLTTKLPFLSGKSKKTAFTATRAGDGTLLVYAGACDDNTSSQMWRYIPGKEAGDGDQPGQWTQANIGARNEGSSSQTGSSYFLGGGLAFSATLAPKMDQPTMYTYGGMCEEPSADADAVQDWQGNGSYTMAMMSLSPERGDIQTPFDIGVASTSGPKAPFAGFSMTQLPPSITNISGAVSQQSKYVFLGGHTQQAFINMSTAAIWNLPQQTWSYVDIRQALKTPDTKDQLGGELKVVKRGAAAIREVTSRSGHTAVLSADGESIVVMGGWVGDVTQPADPQLAVLKMSQTYNSWEWTIPDSQPDGTGLYGHGASLLPGNVMMVYGGWEMQAPKTKRDTFFNIFGRADAAVQPSKFLNLTSMQWATTYKTPVGFQPPHSSNPGTSGTNTNDPDAPDGGKASADKAKKLGLGLGLGLGFGVFAVIAAIALFFCLRRRRQEKAMRDEACQAMMRDSAQYFNDNDEMAERSGYSPWMSGWQSQNSGWQQPGQDSSLMSGARSTEYGGAGAAAVGNIPRKPVTRNIQMQAGGYMPYSNSVSTPGQIHPIFEDDEEDRPRSQMHARNHSHNLPMTPSSELQTDPFATPTAGSPKPVPVQARRHDPAVQEWVADVDMADTLLTQYNSRRGRTSPTKTMSSTREAFRDDESRSGSNLSESTRSQADSLYKKPGSASSGSYLTARSGFGGLQAEAPGLLMGRRSPSSAGNGNNGSHEDEDNAPGSPSKSKPRRGWLGSFRRVFSNTGPNPLVTTPREESPNRLSMEFGSSGNDYEPHGAGVSSDVLRRKQGRLDWEDRAREQRENDWDIERAVEQRLVQVMFTVPKERLRVVNAEEGQSDDDDDEESVAAAAPDVPMKSASRQVSQLGPDDEVLVGEEVPEISPPSTPEPRHLSTISQLQLPDFRAPSPLTLTPRHSQDPFSDARSVSPRRQLIGSQYPETTDVDREILLKLSRSGDLAEPRIAAARSDTDASAARSSPALYTAEAVKYERPKTRVLQMADSFERFGGSGSGSA